MARPPAHNLNPDIQYGNIYGFPDDWVVNAASAYLNGVASVTEADVKPLPGHPRRSQCRHYRVSQTFGSR